MYPHLSASILSTALVVCLAFGNQFNVCAAPPECLVNKGRLAGFPLGGIGNGRIQLGLDIQVFDLGLCRPYVSPGLYFCIAEFDGVAS